MSLTPGRVSCRVTLLQAEPKMPNISVTILSPATSARISSRCCCDSRKHWLGSRGRLPAPDQIASRHAETRSLVSSDASHDVDWRRRLQLLPSFTLADWCIGEDLTLKWSMPSLQKDGRRKRRRPIPLFTAGINHGLVDQFEGRRDSPLPLQKSDALRAMNLIGGGPDSASGPPARNH